MRSSKVGARSNPLRLHGCRPSRPHSHGSGEALWIQQCQLQASHPRWDQEPKSGIFSWRPSLCLPVFIPAWSSPTFPSLAPGSGSDFAKFASSLCEFSDKFWVFGFFIP